MTRLQLKPLKINGCEGCPLAKSAQLSPDMSTSGGGRLKILIVGECQGELEAIKGTQFIGPSGEVLRAALKGIGYDLNRDFWITNAIRCRPKAGKKPSLKEIKACNKKLFHSIHKRKPKMVIALGKSALLGLIGQYVNDITISRFRGTFIPVCDHNFYLGSSFHPSYVSRQDDDYSYATLQRDLKEAIDLVKYIPDNNCIEPLDIKKPIRIITSFSSFNSLMDKIYKEKSISAFDFETTTLKPQSELSQVLSMSICYDGISYSFPVWYPAIRGVFPKGPKDTMWGSDKLLIVEKKIKAYLQDPKLYKIAHNESFERIWSYFCFGAEVKSLGWCTMNAQHILDARQKFCGLKFQAFIRWGVHNYDEEMTPYMKSAQNFGGNSINNLYRAPLDSLLLYGGIDSFLTEKLAKEQVEVFKFGCNKPLKKARRLFHDTTISFTNCQKTGIHIDTEHYQTNREKLTKIIAKKYEKIQASEASIRFKKTTGYSCNIDSPKDLRILLFDILGEESKKKTATKLDSVDKDVLSSLKTPIGKEIVKIREAKKLRDTYIAQYLREEVDGIVYPFIHTHTARSGRSSISMPSLQNTPKRNEKAKKLIRRGIIASPGNKLAEVDFSSLEVRILGCETKDRALLKYLWNPNSDMHYDQTKKLFILTNDEMNKALRYNGKSDFVFLEAYGGEAASSAKYLWFDSIDLKTGKNSDGPKLKTHLAKKGIKTLIDYTEHVKVIEAEFWEKFPGIRQWQKDQGKFYLEHGYVETQFGFRRGGYLNWEKILNTQTQSTAAHLLWWCFNKVDQIRIKENWETKLLGQIHDSIFLDIPPSEEKHVMETVYRVMTIGTVKNFSWVIVPIDVEIEIANVDQSWCDLKEASPEYYRSLSSKKEIITARNVLKQRVINLRR